MRFSNDVRFAIRQLRKSPGFTITVLATLALCIGANTAIYSVVDAVLLRPVPYPEPERLAVVGTYWQSNGREGVEDSQTGRQFEAVRDGASGLDVAASAGDSGANFAGEGVVEYISQQRVSAGFFHVLGVAPQIGREFSKTEDAAGGTAATVLSYPLWQRIFHGDASVLGQAITLRGEPFRVVGIMPRGFRTESQVDLWTPLHPSRTGEGDGSNYRVIARLKPSVSWAQAAAQLKTIGREAAEGSDVPRGAIFEQRILPFQSTVAGDLRSELLLTWGAVLMVLLIGCVNIAGLLLARAAVRKREIATRLALGGSRAAVVRQLLIESIVLSLGGGILGIAVGAFALDGLKALGAQNMELWNPLTLDPRVLIAMFAVALLTSLVFGLMPALDAIGIDIRSALLEGGRGNTGGRRSWMRGALVVSEIALSLVLLVSAGLMVRSIAYLNGLNPGFDTRNVLTAQTSLQDARYTTALKVNRLYTKGLDRMRRIAGVEAAAVALTLPFERPLNDGFRTPDGKQLQRRSTEMVYTTPGYFETLRIPILAGRGFSDSDTADARKVVVISAAFAKKYFDGDAIGRHVELSKTPSEVIGIVGDVQQHSGAGNFGPLSAQPTVYVAAAQMSDASLQLVHTWFPPKWVVRASRPSGALASEMQKAVSAVDPQLPVANFRTIDELQSRVTQRERYHAVIFSLLAGLALVLAGIGLYGLISHSVTQRTREIGIRIALGASVRAAMASAMRPGLTFAVCGVAIGVGLSFGAVRFLRHLIWGVRPVDPQTFAGTAALLLIVTLIATVLPALRVMRLDPATTLRDE